ncbi:hypothetical protein B5S31_g4854 [[Candida] boidinii]|nr:hypothetical protein B5S31_g4854 [[Candida] boidinii]
MGQTNGSTTKNPARISTESGLSITDMNDISSLQVLQPESIPNDELISSENNRGVFESAGDLLESNLQKPAGLVLFLTFIASISGFMFGYDTGYISSVLVIMKDELGGKELTILEKEYITSATSFGALIGSLFAGLLADITGRKPVIILCNILFIIGGLCQYYSVTVTLMIIGRFVQGLGVGCGSLVSPLFISELSPSKFRGKLVIFNCLAITGGQLVAYGIGSLFTNRTNGWRNIIIISILPSLIQLVSFIFLPDTPRYLISKGKFSQATKILQRIYPNATLDLIHANVKEISYANGIYYDYENSDGDEIEDYNNIVYTTNLSTEISKMKQSFTDLIRSKSNIRALIIACGLQLFQQLVGFNALMYFSATIFKMVKYDNATGVSCIVAGTNFLFTIIALLIIDRIGRRKILLISLPLLFLSQILCAVAFKKLDIKIDNPSDKLEFLVRDNGSVSNDENTWDILIIVGIVSFVAFYALGLGNVPWQQSELFPQSVRGVGSSFSTATNWTGSLIISSLFLTLMYYLTPSGTFLLFGLVTIFAILFVYYCYPELSGLQLEQVENLLTDSFNIEESLTLYRNRKMMESKNYTPI